MVFELATERTMDGVADNISLLPMNTSEPAGPHTTGEQKSMFASGRWPRWGRPGHALTTGGHGSVFSSGSASTTGEEELTFASDIYH